VGKGKNEKRARKGKKKGAGVNYSLASEKEGRRWVPEEGGKKERGVKIAWISSSSSIISRSLSTKEEGKGESEKR